MSDHGYYHQPAISGDKIYFVSQDHLWSVAADGGIARRLTSGLGAASYPAIAPDGQRIAFSSSEEGVSGVYVMPSDGGPARRLTFSGKLSRVIDGPREIIACPITSSTPVSRSSRSLHSISALSRTSTALSIASNLGPAEHFSIAPDGRGAVLARLASEAAYRKRYRGGTACDSGLIATGRLMAAPDFARRKPVAAAMDRCANLFRLRPRGRWQYLFLRSGGPGFAPAYRSRRLLCAQRRERWSAHRLSGRSRSVRARSGVGRRRENDRGRISQRANPAQPQIYRRGEVSGILRAASGRGIDRDHLTRQGRFARQLGWTCPANWRARPGRHRLATWLHDGKRIVTVYDADSEQALAIHRVDDPGPLSTCAAPRSRASFG